MGEMADLLMEQMEDEWTSNIVDPFEERLGKLPPFLWLANNGERYVIAKMEARHVVNTVRMLGRWVESGRGDSEADIVGAKRWANLRKRFEAVGGRL